MYETRMQGVAAPSAGAASKSLFLLTWPDGKARALDVSLGACLGYGRPLSLRASVRKLIDSGELVGVVSRPSPAPGDPGGREYWLTEEQSLFVCARARRGAGALGPIIEAFVEARYLSLGLAREALEAGLAAVRAAAEVLGARARAASPSVGVGGVGGPPAALGSPSGALTLRPGDSVVITRTVDTSEYFSAGSIGREFGVSAQVVGRVARELGLFAVDGHGVFREFVPNDGTNPIRHWLYGAEAKAAMRPHLERRREELKRRRRREGAPGGALPFGEGGAKASLPEGTGKEAA